MSNSEEVYRYRKIRAEAIAIVSVLSIPICLLFLIVTIDREYSNTTKKYVIKEGILSSTTFMMENEKPYAVSFEEIEPVYVPEELEVTAKEFISKHIEKENSEYPQVTCRLLETTKTFRFHPKKTTYQIIEMEINEYD